MTRKKWLLIGAAILGLSGIVGASINPMAQTYIAPIVKEQLNNVINGSIDYDSLRINWNGDVVLTDVTIKDRDRHLVGTAQEVAVGVKLSSLPNKNFISLPFALMSFSTILKPFFRAKA